MTDPNQNPDAAGLDMSALLGQAQAMAEQLMAGQAEAEAQVVTGQAGGGAVQVEMTGGGEFTNVTINPSAVDPADVEMLEDLVLAALNDATAQAAELQPNADLGGLDLGGLGGLLGGGGQS